MLHQWVMDDPKATPVHEAHDPGLADFKPIADYALIGDGHSTALVARDGAIDWCCMPRMDADSCFGRILDPQRGGHFTVTVEGAQPGVPRRYETGSMVLCTEFVAEQGRAELHDFFPMLEETGHVETRRLARVLRCTQGAVDVRVEVVPRLDYGEIIPDMRERRTGLYTACGGHTGLVIQSDTCALSLNDKRDALSGHVRLQAGQSLRLCVHFVSPERLEAAIDEWQDECKRLDDDLAQTVESWRAWHRHLKAPFADDALTSRSALVLKALTYEPTGAMVAAATASLPEAIGGARNWDYRYSWVRDSALAVKALHDLGIDREADRFRAFIERSAAGSAEQLQIMYGIDGKRRLTEVRLDDLRGYADSRPVHIGNEAAHQGQLDVYGTLLDLAWTWHGVGRPMDPYYWQFLVEVVDCVCKRWEEPDHGIWEFRDRPRHFVHSKAMCWLALERGLQIADAHGLDAPHARWRQHRDAVRDAIDRRGYDAKRRTFLQAFDEPALDAAVLLLPQFDYLDDRDPRMQGTVQALRLGVDEGGLEEGGLLRRYVAEDGFDSKEGAFLPCTFWLAQSLARQGRIDDAWTWYRRAAACANDLGLLPEEYDTARGCMLGNYPQVLTHLSQMTARMTLEPAGDARSAP